MGIIRHFLFFVLMVFFLLQLVYSDDLSELKNQLKDMQGQIKLQAELINNQSVKIESMRKKIEELESADNSSKETAPYIEERVVLLENKVSDFSKNEFLSLRGMKWQIGGEVELEFVKTKNHASINEDGAHFQLDKVVLSPKVNFTEDIFFYGNFEFYSDSSSVESAYLQFDNLPGDSFAQVGIKKRFMEPDRKTERYPLAGNAFWRDQTAGIFLGGDLEPFYWRFSYTNGYELQEKSATEDASLKIFHDDLRTAEYSDLGEAGIGLGIKKDLGAAGKFDILGFSYFSELSPEDETFLESKISGYGSDDKKQYRYGANLSYSIKGLNLLVETIKAKDGDLDRSAWFVQPSYKIKFPDRKFFTAIEPLFRYGRLNVDTQAVSGNSLTWDRQEFTFALIADVYKNIKLKTEYTIDKTDEGLDGKKSYGEFVSQLEIKF
ncbi:MAG: hypothetical protein PHP69_01265 [Candidatus Omnitrophica bacterium]|nr:hypothetical protein [Candidatus Omnitrophota bacterium]MDD5081673.1 hypothetical protein [Candidatus Omnitrophota bacterium]